MNKQKGFSLLEMLVVLAVIALVSSLMLPSLDRMLALWRLHKVEHSLVAAITTTQSLALVKDEPVKFCPGDAAWQAETLAGAVVLSVDLPAADQLLWRGFRRGDCLVFNAFGFPACNGRLLYFVKGKLRMEIVLSRFGRIKIVSKK